MATIKVKEDEIEAIGDDRARAAEWVRLIIADQAEYRHLLDADAETLCDLALEVYDRAVARTGDPEVGEQYAGLVSVGNDLYWLGRPRHRAGQTVRWRGRRLVYQGQAGGMAVIDDGKW